MAAAKTEDQVDDLSHQFISKYQLYKSSLDLQFGDFIAPQQRFSAKKSHLKLIERIAKNTGFFEIISRTERNEFCEIDLSKLKIQFSPQDPLLSVEISAFQGEGYIFSYQISLDEAQSVSVSYLDELINGSPVKLTDYEMGEAIPVSCIISSPSCFNEDNYSFANIFSTRHDAYWTSKNKDPQTAILQLSRNSILTLLCFKAGPAGFPKSIQVEFGVSPTSFAHKVDLRLDATFEFQYFAVGQVEAEYVQLHFRTTKGSYFSSTNKSDLCRYSTWMQCNR